MQAIFAVLLVAIVATLIAADDPSGTYCEGGTIEDNGLCVMPCPPGTILYAPNCLDVMSKRTCRQPEPVSLGSICDYTHCECVNGLLWDELKSRCVRKEQCTFEKEANGSAIRDGIPKYL